jgi:hypothetical protein
VAAETASTMYERQAENLVARNCDMQPGAPQTQCSSGFPLFLYNPPPPAPEAYLAVQQIASYQ